jgi:hypothetical protein
VDVRAFVIDSDERRKYETRMREKAMGRVRSGLERVQKRVAKGQLKKPEKIGSAVERVLQRNHDIDITPGNSRMPNSTSLSIRST